MQKDLKSGLSLENQKPKLRHRHVAINNLCFSSKECIQNVLSHLVTLYLYIKYMLIIWKWDNKDIVILISQFLWYISYNSDIYKTEKPFSDNVQVTLRSSSRIPTKEDQREVLYLREQGNVFHVKVFAIFQVHARVSRRSRRRQVSS